MRDVLTFILAGGKGERLDPLTKDRAKPAVPFGGIYRIIDFTLSNCINSGLRRIFVLIQYKSFSLQKHIMSGWDEIVSNQLGEFIDVIPAQQRISSDWYRGTADAIHQNSYSIHDNNPEKVLILAGDHIYKMNYRKMVEFHHLKGADMTVSCIPMPVETASSFGVIEVDTQNQVRGFHEKPKNPKTIPSNPSKIFASMGIYLFNTNTLLEELEIDAKSVTSNHDFGRNIIPQMLRNNKKIFVYDFVDENNRPGYWRDIGTRDAYYQANMDLVKPQPEFDLFDRSWPVRTDHTQFPPIKIVSQGQYDGNVIHSRIEDSLIAGGCVVEGAEVIRSVISPNVRIELSARVERSIIMEGVVIKAGAQIRNAIIDKQVIVPSSTKIGYDLEQDRKNFVVTTSGIIIVPKRTVI